MILNIHSKYLDPDSPDKLDSDEAYLFLQLVKRINKGKTCWPSLPTISKDCGWSQDKVKQVIKRLVVTKNLISILRKGNGRKSTVYQINSDSVGVFLGGGKISAPDSLPLSEDGEITPSEGICLPTSEGSKNHPEVLETEVLEIESLETEVLENEKRDFVAFSKGEIFDCLIKNFYPDFSELDKFDFLKYYYSEDFKEKNYLRGGEVQAYQSLDITTRSLFDKIWKAAENIYAGLKTLSRKKLRTISIGSSHAVHGAGPKLYRDEETTNYRKEAIKQIEAYTDFCRITGRHKTKDPQRIAETLIGTDWCVDLFEYTKPQIEKEQYDPGMDQSLESYWLMEIYYWVGSCDIKTCKRYNNRIIDGDSEYLLNRNAEKYNENGKRIE